MQIPLPHAAFPLGDTVPFTVTLLTDETGKPWAASSLGQKDAVELELRWGGTAGSYNRWLLERVGSAPATFALLLGIGSWGSTGLYHYAIRLCREESDYTSGYAQTYTLLRGTFTLY